MTYLGQKFDFYLILMDNLRPLRDQKTWPKGKLLLFISVRLLHHTKVESDVVGASDRSNSSRATTFAMRAYEVSSSYTEIIVQTAIWRLEECRGEGEQRHSVFDIWKCPQAASGMMSGPINQDLITLDTWRWISGWTDFSLFIITPFSEPLQDLKLAWRRQNYLTNMVTLFLLSNWQWQ